MPSYLVAGASRSIGFALVNALAALDSTTIVYAGVRNTPPVPFSNPKVKVVSLDVNSQASVDAAAETVKAGSGSLDVLVINAGIAAGRQAHNSSVAELEECIDTNLIGTHRVIQAFLPLVQAAKRSGQDFPKILAVGSGAGSFAMAPNLQNLDVISGPYGVSKAALHYLMLDLALGLKGDGILAATIDPGIVATDGAKKRAEVFPDTFIEKITAAGLQRMTPEQSAEGIVKIIDGLQEDNTGKMLAWHGELQVMPF